MDQQGQPNFASFGGQGYINPGGNEVFSSGVSSEQKSKKKFVIIGLVVGVVAIVAVVLALMFRGGGLFGGPLAGFSELREFIEKGDAETRALFGDEDVDDSDDFDGEESAEESSEESEYIMAIRISEQGEAEVRKYYSKLARLEQEFYKKSVDRVDAGLLSEYENALKVLKNAINYYEAKEGLIAAYENGGNDGADLFFIENLKCDKNSGDLMNVCNLEQSYYAVALSEHKIYSNAGCYNQDGYDLDCAENYYGLSGFIDEYDRVGNSLRMARDLSLRIREKSALFNELNKKISGEENA